MNAIEIAIRVECYQAARCFYRFAGPQARQKVARFVICSYGRTCIPIFFSEATLTVKSNSSSSTGVGSSF